MMRFCFFRFLAAFRLFDAIHYLFFFNMPSFHLHYLIISELLTALIFTPLPLMPYAWFIAYAIDYAGLTSY